MKEGLPYLVLVVSFFSLVLLPVSIIFVPASTAPFTASIAACVSISAIMLKWLLSFTICLPACLIPALYFLHHLLLFAFCDTTKYHSLSPYLLYAINIMCTFSEFSCDLVCHVLYSFFFNICMLLACPLPLYTICPIDHPTSIIIGCRKYTLCTSDY